MLFLYSTVILSLRSVHVPLFMISRFLTVAYALSSLNSLNCVITHEAAWFDQTSMTHIGV